MKTTYKYLEFTELESKGETSKWSCRNKKVNDELGIIRWFLGWRQYCFFPTCQAVYSMGCLNDIADFIKQLKQKGE